MLNLLDSNKKWEYISEDELSKIYKEQYNDVFSKILCLNNNQFMNVLQKQIITYLYIIKKQPIISHLSRINEYYVNKYNEDKEQVFEAYKELKEMNPNDVEYLNKNNCYLHCPNTTEAYHTCGNKFTLCNDFIFCFQCKKVYNEEQAKMFCDYCQSEYYTTLREIENEESENFFPVSYSSHHCICEKDEKLKCKNCKEELYVDINAIKNDKKKKIENLFCPKCKNNYNVKNLDIKCQKCQKKYYSEVKLYNEFNYVKTDLLCIVHTLLKKKFAHPRNIIKKTCKCQSSNMKKYIHQIDKGVLLEGLRYGKRIILCSKCFKIFNFQSFNWNCPECGRGYNNLVIKTHNNSIINDYRNNKINTTSSDKIKDNEKIFYSEVKADKMAKNENKKNNENSVNNNNTSYIININNRNGYRRSNIKTNDIQDKNVKIISINDTNNRSNNKLNNSLLPTSNIQLRNVPNIINSDSNENKTSIINISNNIQEKRKNNNSTLGHSQIVITKVNTKKENSTSKFFSPENKESQRNISKDNNKKVDERKNVSINGEKNIKRKSIEIKDINLLNKNASIAKSSVNIHSINSIISPKNNLSYNNNDKEKKNEQIKDLISQQKERIKKNYSSDRNKKDINKPRKSNDNNIMPKIVNKGKENENKKIIIDDKVLKRDKISPNHKIITITDSEKKLKNSKSQNVINPRYTKVGINISQRSKENTGKKDNDVKIYIKEEDNEEEENNNEKNDITNTPSKSIMKSIFKNKNEGNDNITIVKSNMSTNILSEGYHFNSDDFKPIQLLGEGTFGKIYLVEDPVTSEKFALKKIPASDKDELSESKREFELLLKLSKENPNLNVVKIYGIQLKKLDNFNFVLYVLMEAAKCDWECEINNRSKFRAYYTEEELIKILMNLVSTLAWLQKNGICHRDVKPQNVLCFGEGKYKLTDFGEAKKKKNRKFNGEIVDFEGDTSKQTVRGTELYMSPCLFKALHNCPDINLEYNAYKSDVFSLGFCMLYASTLGFEALYKIRELYDFNKMKKIIEEHLEKRYSKEYIKLIVLMVQLKEKKRPDFIELENYIQNNYY